MPRIFEGQPVTILGGGYSLTGFNWQRVRHPAIAVNYSIINFPDAEVSVGLDSGFFTTKREYFDPDEFFKTYRGYMITDREPLPEKALKVQYEGVALPESEKNIDWHCQSANISGFFALALAFHLGASKVYLLGFDGGYYQQSNHYYHNPNITSATLESINVHYEFFKNYPVLNVINPAFPTKIQYFKTCDINSNFYDHETF